MLTCPDEMWRSRRCVVQNPRNRNDLDQFLGLEESCKGEKEGFGLENHFHSFSQKKSLSSGELVKRQMHNQFRERK